MTIFIHNTDKLTTTTSVQNTQSTSEAKRVKVDTNPDHYNLPVIPDNIRPAGGLATQSLVNHVVQATGGVYESRDVPWPSIEATMYGNYIANRVANLIYSGITDRINELVDRFVYDGVITRADDDAWRAGSLYYRGRGTTRGRGRGGRGNRGPPRSSRGGAPAYQPTNSNPPYHT